MSLWTCQHCQSEQPAENIACDRCYRDRYANYAIMKAEHVLECIADGLITPLDVLKNLSERHAYQRIKGDPYSCRLTLQEVASTMRLVTTDTTAIARQIARARSAPAMLRVFEEGKPAELIQALAKWGPQTNTEYTETKVDAVTRHVVELHEGPPPKRDA